MAGRDYVAFKKHSSEEFLKMCSLEKPGSQVSFRNNFMWSSKRCKEIMAMGRSQLAKAFVLEILMDIIIINNKMGADVCG